MAKISISETERNENNLLYIQSGLAEAVKSAEASVNLKRLNGRAVFSVDMPDRYEDIFRAEIADKAAEIVAVKYKYDYFKKEIKIGGLTEDEKEILLASLIAADLEDDKKYAFDRIKLLPNAALDGTFNFGLKPLKRKWEDIVSYMPSCFVQEQLKDFVTFLLENKRKRVYVDCGRVYDSHFRRLVRTRLLEGENVKIVREVLLSNGGEIELSGRIPETDEYYLKEFYRDKIFFSSGYFG